ncbi:MAG: phosphoadenosine phosphosulfate reductase family protein [Pseudomonadales bacterium]|nr:phosphoadenosine phosphosulfate reductase family protein [Pseudomonadales bacterium]MDG2078608.1 phosphoadenosine phosphosulfate reductase family protein [Pseudomonadales bacterium]
MDLNVVNQSLRNASPREIIRWAVAQKKKMISTTSFGKNAAVMLHMAQAEAPGLPVIWVDTGYNLRDTYVVAERLIKSLDLNMQIFSPQMTSERRNSIMGGIPTIEDIEQHEEFTRQVKLEPFNQAIELLQPEIWLTGIRQQETDHRKTLDIVSIDGRGIIKVAPIFYWDDDQVESYMREHSLISCRHYFDPTKVHDGRECGLHTSA